MTLLPGRAEPPGASYDGKGVNFTLFSRHAARVELCLFDQGKERRFDLPARTGDIWHGYAAALKPGQRYGFRVHGPWAPERGHRFNPAKLLVDPCARAVEGEVTDDPRLYGGIEQPDEQDSAAVAPKSLVVAEDFAGKATSPRVRPGATRLFTKRTSAD